MSSRDLHSEITAKIVTLLETNPQGWLKPWSCEGAESGMPYNAVTRKAYRGINVPMLWAAQRAGGFKSARWASYNQWGGRGAHVRKGEKGTLIVFYKSLTVKDGAKPDNPDATKRIPLLRCWTVFNADQVDGDKGEIPVAPKPLPERLAAVESYISATGATVHHGGDRAYYSPAMDHIGMPELGAFRDTKDGTAREHYYSVFLHELTHWTGAKSRCDRSLRGRFGDEEYAMEELIAELGAAFQCAALGIDQEPRADHAKYIASWLKVLKSDKRAVFTAASKAAQAVDYLGGLQAADDEANGDSPENTETMAQAA